MSQKPSECLLLQSTDGKRWFNLFKFSTLSSFVGWHVCHVLSGKGAGVKNMKRLVCSLGLSAAAGY